MAISKGFVFHIELEGILKEQYVQTKDNHAMFCTISIKY